MKLTTEDYDYMDCRPGPGRYLGPKHIPPWMPRARAAAEAEAAREEAGKTRQTTTSRGRLPPLTAE